MFSQALTNHKGPDNSIIPKLNSASAANSEFSIDTPDGSIHNSSDISGSSGGQSSSSQSMDNQAPPNPGPMKQAENETSTSSGTSGRLDDPIEEGRKGPKTVDREKIKKQWGYDIDELFEICLKFYKNNESKAFHPTFEERNRLNALIVQSKHGRYNEKKMPEIGVLDLVGKNRRHQWSLLGDMSKFEAKHNFITTIDELCPLFKAFVEAIRLDSINQTACKSISNIDKNHVTKSKQQTTGDTSETSTNDPTELDATKQEDLLQQQYNEEIYNTLCRQTNEQFSKYALSQYPNDQIKRQLLVQKLQMQYYNQYMQQVYQQQQQQQQQQNQYQYQHQHQNQQKHLHEHLQLPVSTYNYINQQYKTNIADHNNVKQDSTLVSAALSSSNYPTVAEGAINQANQSTSVISCSRTNNQEHNDKREINQNNNNNPEQLLKDTEIKSFTHASPNQSNGTPRINTHKPFLNTGQQQLDNPQQQQLKQNQYQQQATAVENKNNDANLHSTITTEEATNQMSHDDLLGKFNNISFDGLTSSLGQQQQKTQPQLQQQRLGIHPIDQNHECENQFKEDSSVHSSATSDARTQSTTTDDESCSPIGTNHQCAENHNCCSDLDDHQHGQVADDDEEAWQIQASAACSLGLSIATPSLWTRNTIDEFKESIRNEGRDGIFVVHYGESVTVRAPTRLDGKSIYWEFATDSFDIGFGVLFQYDKLPSQLAAASMRMINNAQRRHQNGLGPNEPDEDDDNGGTNGGNDDSDDGDDEDSLAMDNKRQYEDLEKGLVGSSSQPGKNPASIVVIPVYRRDSHEEVYAGRHDYPGQGVYLLKFDNTYSKLRSKTVYYRVCYYPHHVSLGAPTRT